MRIFVFVAAAVRDRKQVHVSDLEVIPFPSAQSFDLLEQLEFRGRCVVAIQRRVDDEL